MIESRLEALEGHGREPSSGELDSEREPVQSSADRGDDRCGVVGEREGWIVTLRTRRGMSTPQLDDWCTIATFVAGMP